MFAHIHSINGSGSSCKICQEYPGTEIPRSKDSGKRRVLQYIDDEGDSLITIFFQNTTRWTQGILSQNSFGSNARHVSGDLRLVFTELLRRFSNISETVYQGHPVLLLSLVNWLRMNAQLDTSINTPPEVLEHLKGQGFSQVKIAMVFRVSRWTIMHLAR